MKNIFFNSLDLAGLTRILRISKRNSLTVLNFHRISEERDFFYNPIKPKLFREIIDYCCNNYTISKFDEIEKPSKKPRLVLSFDDGYYDFIENALPYLIQKGLPSNHNIVNNCVNNNSPIWTHELNDIFSTLRENKIIDDPQISKNVQFDNNWMKYYLSYFKFLLTQKKEIRQSLINELRIKYNIKTQVKMMNWEDLMFCVKNDVEIGSHSFSHDSLNTLTNQLDFKNEIEKSIIEINNKLGIEVSTLALPNGQFNDLLIEYIQNYHLKNVLLANDLTGITKLNNGSKLINRIGLFDGSLVENKLKIELFQTKINRFLK